MHGLDTFDFQAKMRDADSRFFVWRLFASEKDFDELVLAGLDIEADPFLFSKEIKCFAETKQVDVEGLGLSKVAG